MTLMGVQANYNLTNLSKPHTYPDRCRVIDQATAWRIQDIGYDPLSYTDPMVLTAEWAESEYDVDRVYDRDFTGRLRTGEFTYIDSDGQMRTVCPWGRTGVAGRGLLGKFGPNNVANMIAYVESYEPSLLIIQRMSGSWGLPGGFVDDADSSRRSAAIREFHEELKWDPTENGLVSEEPLIPNLFTPAPVTTDEAWLMSHFYSCSVPAALRWSRDEIVDFKEDEVQDTAWVTASQAEEFSILPVHLYAIGEFCRKYKYAG